MVKDTGKTLRTDTYRPVNAPQSVEVEEDASGVPLAVKIPPRQVYVKDPVTSLSNTYTNALSLRPDTRNTA